MKLQQVRALVPMLFVMVGTAAAGQRPAVSPPSLLEAVRTGDRAAVRALIQKRADVNVAEPDGTTALLRAVFRDDAETVDLLLGAGANATAANRYGVTPLLVGCTNGNVIIIEKLLKAGADPNSQSAAGETALMTAARTGKVEAVRLLLARGAQVNKAEAERTRPDRADVGGRGKQRRRLESTDRGRGGRQRALERRLRCAPLCGPGREGRRGSLPPRVRRQSE
jgi:ankyrin repeat protein